MIYEKRPGFAHMPLERVREIARLGGLAAQASGNVRRWTPEEARENARKSARVRRGRRR